LLEACRFLAARFGITLGRAALRFERLQPGRLLRVALSGLLRLPLRLLLGAEIVRLAPRCILGAPERLILLLSLGRFLRPALGVFASLGLALRGVLRLLGLLGRLLLRLASRGILSLPLLDGGVLRLPLLLGLPLGSVARRALLLLLRLADLRLP
jgi:hypothetical protein